MARILLDTDVLVDQLRKGRRPPEVRDAAYSSITRAELYAGRDTDEIVVDLLLAAFEEVPVQRTIAEEAGRIRRIAGTPLPDALIAATAIVTARALATRNVKHFAGIPGLRIHGSNA